MTKEKILEYFNDINVAYNECMRYDSLKSMLDELQEPCADAISRQSIEEIINDIRDCISVEGYWAILERMKKLPPVTPQPKTGHWIKVTNGRGGHECDACHVYAPSYKNGDEHLTAICPNCGAKMSEGSES